LIKIDDSTYKYFTHLTYGFGVEIDTCKTKEELRQRQKEICANERKKLAKKSIEVTEPDILNWACQDQGAIGRFRRDRRHQDGSSHPVSWTK
jgi:hypothetical protein